MVFISVVVVVLCSKRGSYDVRPLRMGGHRNNELYQLYYASSICSGIVLQSQVRSSTTYRLLVGLALPNSRIRLSKNNKLRRGKKREKERVERNYELYIHKRG